MVSQGPEKPLYLDPSQPVEKRIEDLLGRMTLKEKVGQMNMPCVYMGQLGKDPVAKQEGCRRFTLGTSQPRISGRAAVSSRWPIMLFRWARASRLSISTSCKDSPSRRRGWAFRCSKARRARTG